jgi:hypothetical protein
VPIQEREAQAEPTVPISSVFEDLESFLRACGEECSCALAVLKQQRVPLRMLPNLSRTDLMQVLHLQLGPSLLIENEARKYLPA